MKHFTLAVLLALVVILMFGAKEGMVSREELDKRPETMYKSY